LGGTLGTAASPLGFGQKRPGFEFETGHVLA